MILKERKDDKKEYENGREGMNIDQF